MVRNISNAEMKMVAARFAIANNLKKEKKREKKTSSMGETSLLRK